jgi:hypothetical protein
MHDNHAAEASVCNRLLDRPERRRETSYVSGRRFQAALTPEISGAHETLDDKRQAGVRVRWIEMLDRPLLQHEARPAASCCNFRRL